MLVIFRLFNLGANLFAWLYILYIFAISTKLWHVGTFFHFIKVDDQERLILPWKGITRRNILFLLLVINLNPRDIRTRLPFSAAAESIATGVSLLLWRLAVSADPDVGPG